MQDCIGIILARAGSRRVKNKNFLKLDSKYVFEYPMEQALKTRRFKKIIFSTDESKKNLFNNIEKKKLFKNKLLFHERNKQMLKNKFPMLPIVSHIINSELLTKVKYKYIFMIYATAINVKKKDYINMLNIIKKNENKNKKYGFSVQTLTKYPAPIEWAMSLDSKNKIKINFNHKIMSSNTYKSYFYDSGVLQLFNKKYFSSKVGKKQLGYNIGKVRGIDVDDLEDLYLTKSVFFNKTK